jgi:hypothetical protein
MPHSPIAAASDYADAMLVCRRAKNWLIGMLLALLLMELGIFLWVRFGSASILAPTSRVGAVAEYLLSFAMFAAVVLVAVLAMVLLLLVNIMLVGRLIGVAQVTNAFICALVAAGLLFPWQVFIHTHNPATVDFNIPGVLYTWDELQQYLGSAAIPSVRIEIAILKWSRFVAFPIIGIIVLLLVHTRSRRGLRLALGETQPPEIPGEQ